MWLAQFVCAPQFFKTSNGLCGHTVYYPCTASPVRVFEIFAIDTLKNEEI
jgi:hypothetical protein